MNTSNIPMANDSTTVAFQYWQFAFKNQAVEQFFSRVDHNVETAPPRQYNLPVQQRAQQPTNWFLIISLIILVVFAYLRTVYPKKLSAYYEAFTNNAKAEQLLRDEQNVNTLPSILLLLVSIASISSLYYAFMKHFSISLFNLNGAGLFVTLFMLTLVFMSIKTIVVQSTGFLFQLREELNFYLFTQVLFNYFTGLLLIPLTTLYFYGITVLKTPALYVAMSVLLLLFSYRILNIIIKGIQTQHVSGVYIILYICTFEIAPILIVGKLLV